MRHQTFLILPWDTGSFRDARPFYQDDQGMAEAFSQFPPSQRTAVGSIRAALARAAGWSGRGGWGDSVKALLGDGENLAPLSFSALTLVRKSVSEDAGGRWEAMVPMPFSLGYSGHSLSVFDRAISQRRCSETKPQFIEWRPMDQSVSCDNRNPMAPWSPHSKKDLGERVSALEGYVVSAHALRARFAPNGGELNKALDYSDVERLEASAAQLDEGRPVEFSEEQGFDQEVWGGSTRLQILKGMGACAVRETSIGIGRDSLTRRVVDKRLYQNSMIRLLPDHGYVISVSSSKDDMPALQGPVTVPFGGEGRAATLVRLEDDVTDLRWSFRWREREGKIALCLMSPAAFDEAPRIGAPLWEKGPAVIGVAGGRTAPVGGWSGESGKAGSVGGAAYYPAGTVWFVEGPVDDVPGSLGRKKDWPWGFGKFVAWPLA